MRALHQCRCDVITAGSDAPVTQLANLMDLHSVGCIVIVDDAGGPLGIVTDRDLLTRVVAAGRHAEKTTAREVMSEDVLAVDADDPLPKVLDRMRERGVRRVPVLEQDRVTGIASLDDVLMTVSSDLWNVSEAVRIELRDSQRSVLRRRWGEQRHEARSLLGSQARDLAHGIRHFAARELEHAVASFRRRR